MLWHCWFGHMTSKIVPEMTYNVSSGTLSLYTTTTTTTQVLYSRGLYWSIFWSDLARCHCSEVKPGLALPGRLKTRPIFSQLEPGNGFSADYQNKLEVGKGIYTRCTKTTVTIHCSRIGKQILQIENEKRGIIWRCATDEGNWFDLVRTATV